MGYLVIAKVSEMIEIFLDEQLFDMRPSRKRCRSPTTYLPTAVSAPTFLSHVPADRPSPRKRLRGSPALSHQADFQYVAEALTTHEINQNNENWNDNRNGNRNGTNDNAGGDVQVTRACTYKDFANYQPRNFNGTEGVVGLCIDTVELSCEDSWNRCYIWNALESAHENDDISELALLCPGMVPDEEKMFERSECWKLKNQNHRNQVMNEEARRRAYALGGGESNRDSNVITGTFFLNNRYASTLCDSSADMSFMSTTFSSLIDILPTTLDVSYDVELADKKIIGADTIIRGCTLNLLNHPFNIDIMPIEIGSFDMIIRMDWVLKYHAMIVYDEKIVRITLRKRRRKTSQRKSDLRTIVWDSMEVFPEDLPGLPPTQQVEFKINLVPGVAPVARSPYRLASSKMQEVSN
nr:hypothetical protein [Tanacetum cinerariifolium]